MTNISETIKAKTSAKVIDHHIPSIPKISAANSIKSTFLARSTVFLFILPSFSYASKIIEYS